MSHIFISYSRRDLVFAQKIVDALAANNLDTWIDWKSIPKGEDWEQEIYRGIEEAEAFLFLISPDSVESEMCNKEIDHAVKNGKRILPIFIANVDDRGIYNVTEKFLHEEQKEEINRRNFIICRQEKDDFHKAMVEVQKTIHTDYEWLKYHTELQVKALRWKQQEDNTSRLLRGKELQESELQLANAGTAKEPQPTDLQRQYVFVSRQTEDRQRRQITLSLGFGLAIVALLAIFAWNQRNSALYSEATAIAEANAKATALVNEENARATAQSERSRAEEQALIAHVGELSVLATSLQNEEIDVALLLSVEAILEKKTSQSWNALYTSFSAHNHLFSLFRGHENSLLSVAFSPDRQLVATGDADGAIRLWSIHSGGQTDIQFAGHIRNVKNLIFSADGNVLISSGCSAVRDNSCAEYSVKLWDTKTGQNVGDLLSGSADEITDIVLSPEGNVLAVANSNNSIEFWDIYERERIGESIFIETYLADFERFIVRHTGFNSLAFSPDGKTLASGGCNETFEWGCRAGEIRLWDVETRRQLGSPIVAHEGYVRSISFSPDNETIATGSCGDFIDPIVGCGIGEIIVWDVSTRRQVGQTMQGHKFVNSISFSPDGKTLASGGCQGTGLSFGFSGQCLQGKLIIWDITSGRPAYESTYSHKDNIQEVAFSPDGNFIISVSDDRTAALWEAVPKNPFRYSAEYSKELSNAQFSKGNTTVLGLDFLSGNLSNNQFLVDSRGYTAGATSPDNTKLATGGFEGEITVHDNITHTPILELPARHTSQVRSLTFSTDGKLLVSGGHDDLIMWDATTWKMLYKYENIHQSLTTILEFSTNEPTLISGGTDGFIVWDVLSNTLKMQSMNELKGGVSAIAFHPSENIFATGGFDNRIFLWNTAEEENMLWEKHQISDPVAEEDHGWIESLVFSTDGRFLLSQDLSSITSVWITDPNIWIDKNCKRAGRNLTESEWERYIYWKPYDPEYKICPQWPAGE